MAGTKNVMEVCNLIKAFGTGITGFEMKTIKLNHYTEGLGKFRKKRHCGRFFRSSFIQTDQIL